VIFRLVGILVVIGRLDGRNRVIVAGLRAGEEVEVMMDTEDTYSLKERLKKVKFTPLSPAIFKYSAIVFWNCSDGYDELALNIALYRDLAFNSLPLARMSLLLSVTVEIGGEIDSNFAFPAVDLE